jgi:hypothetical protein
VTNLAVFEPQDEIFRTSQERIRKTEETFHQ